LSTPTSRALRENLLFAALALVAVHMVGTVGFYWVAQGKASFFDAFYMTFITVATIGYAETIDLSGDVPGRVFNVAIAISGIGCIWVMFSNFTALLLARAMDPARQRARLVKEVRVMQGNHRQLPAATRQRRRPPARGRRQRRLRAAGRGAEKRGRRVCGDG
jgi:voltage-gated potassium channel